MNGTPRLRSAFPTSPTPARHPRRSNLGNTSAVSSGRLESPKVKSVTPLPPQNAAPAVNSPVISFDTIDAPSQRLYAAAAYVALVFWRLYDFYNLTLDESESLWLFMKWVSIDGVFLFGLPSMRIPWLEWSSATMMLLFAVHTLFNGILMFRIPVRCTHAPPSGRIPLTSRADTSGFVARWLHSDALRPRSCDL